MIVRTGACVTQNLFRWIWRFNAVAIAGVSLIAMLIGAYAVFHIAREIIRRPYEIYDAARIVAPKDAAGGKSGKASGVQSDARTNLSVLQFTAMRGTPILYAAITAHQDYDYSYSSKEASSTRNYAFYDRVTGASRTLFPDSAQVIFELRELWPDNAASNGSPKALLVSYVAADGNGDGMLNGKDQKIVALAKPDGTGLTAVSGTAMWTRGAFVDKAGGEAVLMIEGGDATEAVHVDLATFRVTKTQAIAR